MRKVDEDLTKVMTTPVTADQAFVSYFECPDEFAAFASSLAPRQLGLFTFGPDTICYGQCSSGVEETLNGAPLRDSLQAVTYQNDRVVLPFDPTEVAENLRRERYVAACLQRRDQVSPRLHSLYYHIRPFLPVGLRRHLQRARLSGWEKQRFPAWPVDKTVDRLMEGLLRILLEHHAVPEFPFIWFWPEGHSSCAILTHDVETAAGRDFCSQLMDIDESYGIHASFQVIPEERYSIPQSFLQTIRDRGFEVNIHDLNHDGFLFRNLEEFKRRAAKINQYGSRFGAMGFRSGALYRNQDWFKDLEFAYDMSVPNAGHLEAQTGGCCTVMPYFVGDILEIPVTATQDYTLFNILGQYSIELWKRELDALTSAHGLASFIAHPDYLMEKAARTTYSALLEHLVVLQKERDVWIPLPSEVNTWWRQRSQMCLVREGDSWVIRGAGSERASIAWAGLDSGELTYTFESQRPADCSRIWSCSKAGSHAV